MNELRGWNLAWSRPSLHRDLSAAFKTANLYRHQRVHWWGFPAPPEFTKKLERFCVIDSAVALSSERISDRQEIFASCPHAFNREFVFRSASNCFRFRSGKPPSLRFSSSLSNPYQEEHAVAAAIEMQKELAALCSKWEAEGRPAIRMGIGINSGAAVVGNIGSDQRMEYTAIGDTVNLAARLESASKDLGVAYCVVGLPVIAE